MEGSSTLLRNVKRLRDCANQATGRQGGTSFEARPCPRPVPGVETYVLVIDRSHGARY